MAKSNPDYLKDDDHLLSAKQMMGQYWNRPADRSEGTEWHKLSRIVDLLEVVAEAQVSIAESQHHLATGERARK